MITSSRVDNFNFDPARLKEAREARGHTARYFAELIDVTPQAVSQYEVGQTKPKWDVLLKIASVLNVPVTFFSTQPLASREQEQVFYRSLKSTQKQERQRLKRKSHWVKDLVVYLERYLELPKVEFPAFEWLQYDDVHGLEVDDIERAASELREYWKLGKGPIANIVKLLEAKGAVVVRQPFECEKMDGFSLWYKSRPYIYLSSDKTNGTRSRFDAAHEAGHAILHAGVELTEKNFDRIEKEAHRFASAFLLPRESFAQEVFSSNLEHFIELKKRWKVSIAAMIYRCQNLGLLNDNQIQYLRKRMNALGITKREPLDDIIEIEKPRLLHKAITALIDNNVVSRDDICREVSLLPFEIEQICNLQAGYLLDKQNDNVIYINVRPKQDGQPPL